MKRTTLFIIVIIFLAFLVRIAGVSYGLPFAYHDDEPIIVNYALAYASGDFNPHAFKMSPFLSYMLFFVYGLFFIIGYILRYFKNITDFAYLYINNPTAFYLIGRILLGTLFGTASVLLLYIAGKRYFDKKTAFLAAIFLAFNYLHVRDSHYLYFDVPLTFFVILFFIKAYDILRPNARKKDFIYLGIAFGLAASVKYSGAVLMIPLILVLLYNFRIAKEKRLYEKATEVLCCAMTSLVVLFILNPYSFLDFSTFKKDLLSLPFIPMPNHFHLNISLINGCGRGLVILGIFGVLRSIMVRRNNQLLLSAYAIFYYWLINRSSQPAERIVMPLVPVILLFAASVIIKAISFIKRQKAEYVFGFILVLALMWPGLVRIYYSDLLFTREDTRTSAYRWIGENIENNTKIALDATASWFPRLQKNKEQIRELTENSDLSQFAKPRGASKLKMKFIVDNPHSPGKTYRLFYLKEEPDAGFSSTQPGIPIEYSSIKAKDIEYIVLSNILIQEGYAKFIGDIEKRSVLLKTFSPYKKGVERISPNEKSSIPAAGFMLQELKDRKSYGPVIRIYKIK